jgi:hypothetical protein
MCSTLAFQINFPLSLSMDTKKHSTLFEGPSHYLACIMHDADHNPVNVRKSATQYVYTTLVVVPRHADYIRRFFVGPGDNCALHSNLP